jgi:hypothetical protein
MRKSLPFLLIISIMVSSVLMVDSAFAQSIPKPSVPEFTLKLVAHPYDVPPKYEVNPYTGKNEMTEAGYHVENKSIEVTIKNQPFVSSLDEDGEYANLYYTVRFKGHYEDTWRYYPHDLDSNYSTAVATPFNASESEYTTITLGLATYLLNNVPAGGEVDFQVEAYIGYENRVDFVFLHDIGHYYTFSDFERSGWSSTQTIAIPTSGSPSPRSSSPISTPNVTIELEISGGLQALQLETILWTTAAIVLLVCALVYFRKRRMKT